MTRMGGARGAGSAAASERLAHVAVARAASVAEPHLRLEAHREARQHFRDAAEAHGAAGKMGPAQRMIQHANEQLHHIKAIKAAGVHAGSASDTHGQHSPTPENPQPIQTGTKGGEFVVTAGGHKRYMPKGGW